MTEIKALEELRESFDDCTTEAGIEPNKFDTVWITKSCAMSMLDRIQAEVDSRFMELPLDADGVPIRVGDVVVAQDEQPFEVRAFQLDALGWFAIERLGSQWNVNQLHHVKPRTLEDVLEEFTDLPERIDRIVAIPRYATEIRELLGVDA